MIEKCQVFTPKDAVIKLLDVIEYKNDLFGKKVIENACGDGNILTVVVERYILDCLNNGYSNETIKNGLESDIYGAEIDEGHYKQCVLNLNEIAERYGIHDVTWKILNVDILKENLSIKFDFVVGNPPYITYKDLDIETRIFVKENFEVCKEGKFDYCYAFIEASIKLLNDTGKLSYLIPSSIFKNVFANNLRNYLLPTLKQIYDYQTIKLFNVLTSSAIIVCDKENILANIDYVNLDKKTSHQIKKTNLTGKWDFSLNESKIKISKFGDYFKASITIATLFNEAFILKNYSEVTEIESQKKYVRANSFLIEKDLLKEAVSPRSLGYNKKELIIFPYSYKEGLLKRYGPSEFEECFPQGTQYLKSFYTKLQERDSDKNVNWFEYGRTQALTHINQEKLLVSTVVTNKVNVYKLEKEKIPYSGIYIIKKSDLDLDFAKRILESKEFFEYANSIGINANGSSLRITAKDINNYVFNLEEV